MSREELHKLTVDEYKELEANTMERNAWRVSQDVVSRIDGEPGPAGDCMRAFVTVVDGMEYTRDFQFTL